MKAQLSVYDKNGIEARVARRCGSPLLWTSGPWTHSYGHGLKTRRRSQVRQIPCTSDLLQRLRRARCSARALVAGSTESPADFRDGRLLDRRSHHLRRVWPTDRILPPRRLAAVHCRTCDRRRVGQRQSVRCLGDPLRCCTGRQHLRLLDRRAHRASALEA